MSWKFIAPAIVGMVCLIAGCKPTGSPSLPATNQPPGQLQVIHEDRAAARDWPQWRHDANRTAASPEPLPPVLHLQWTRDYGQRMQAWDDPLNNDLMTYDRVFEPVVLEGRMFLGFNDCDKVVALDALTGRELWTFHTDGPVRLPPAAWEGRVYFSSDDGHLYCVNAADGALVWKHRGAPSGRKVLGNNRLISAWPARGGPVVRDGQVYYAASIWPFMGIYLYALDARTGRVVWENDGTGAIYMKQPHSAPAFAGLAPQGALVATRDRLIVPGGRSVPAVFDRQTGRMLYFHLDDGGKGNGGSFVAASDTEFFVHTRRRGTRAFDLKAGRKGDAAGNEPVLTTNRFFSIQEHSSLSQPLLDGQRKLADARQLESEFLADVAKAEDESDRMAYRQATNFLASARRKIARAEAEILRASTNTGTNWTGSVIQALGADKRFRWELSACGTGDIIKAGERLYAGGSNVILTVELLTNKLARLVATNKVEGRVERLLAANGMLFAVTLQGRILAFGAASNPPVRLVESPLVPALSPAAVAEAEAILSRSGVREGFAICFGVDDGARIEALARQSQLRIVAVEPEASRIESLRRRLDAAGLYGTRVSVHAGDPATFKAPPYFASLIVVGNAYARRLADPSVWPLIYESLRPYGGFLWVPAGPPGAQALADQARQARLPGAEVKLVEGALAITRPGRLAGSADWTHQYGDIANTLKSDDRLVRVPLGLLWFGGTTHMDVLPRHGHGPAEQVVGGRLFIQGLDSLSARDVYTGRLLWKADLPDLDTYGIYYDASYTNLPLSTIYNQKHIPGSNARGANYVATADEIYLAVSNTCRVLDARNGRLLRTVALPVAWEDDQPREWGFIGVCDDVLLGGNGFARFTRRLALVGTNQYFNVVDVSGSRGLVAFDRHTGRKLWEVEALHSFLHNGIAAGGGRVYCLDRLPKSMTDKLRRRGRIAPADYRIAAFDLRNGALLWETRTNVFGTWLAYSGQHDILLQAGARATDRLRDEAKEGMIACRAATGAVLWQKLDLRYTGPCILHNDTILTTPTSYSTNSGAFGLQDGKPRLLPNPLTGEMEPWRIYKTYGCGYSIACENLITFRSGAAGFYDLENQGGTGNLGGFKSSCSPNLIAADGVLNAPDYTRTCTCAYQNQTSLAFIHWPELELWTHSQYGANLRDGTRIKRVGVNFGAPGDRLADSGTLWLDSPNVSGSSPSLTVTVRGSTNYFRHHASALQGQGPSWVMASGVRDASSILIIPETRRSGPPPSAPVGTLDDDDYDYDAPLNGADGYDLFRAPVAKSNQMSALHRPESPPAYYTVRLYFSEPDELQPRQRVFDVSLQGRRVLKDFDIAAQAGGPRRGLVKEFRRVLVKKELEIRLSRGRNAGHGPVLCGVEMILEGESASPR